MTVKFVHFYYNATLYTLYIIKILLFIRFVKIKDIFVNFVKKIQLYFRLMKIFTIVINVVMCITTNVGIIELSVPNVKELKNDLKLKRDLSKCNLKIKKE